MVLIETTARDREIKTGSSAVTEKLHIVSYTSKILLRIKSHKKSPSCHCKNVHIVFLYVILDCLIILDLDLECQ